MVSFQCAESSGTSATGAAVVADGGVTTTDGRTFTANLPVAGSLVY